MENFKRKLYLMGKHLSKRHEWQFKRYRCQQHDVMKF